MMSWSPTPRTSAVSGLARLYCREEWRSSHYGHDINRVLTGMLTDHDKVNRLHAAQIAPLLADDTAALDLITRRLLDERHPTVAACLMNHLARFRDSNPAEVDRVVAEALVREPWTSALQRTGRNGRDECVEFAVGLVLYLALKGQTPNALRLSDTWFRNPASSEASRRAIQAMRPWLELGPERAAERSRAFELLNLAAATLEQRRTADNLDVEFIRNIYLCADDIVDTIYFASGAYTPPGEHPRLLTPGFAGEAFSALSLLTGFRSPPTVHRAVETLAYLAPIDPRRAFLLVSNIVQADDPYTYDSLAVDTVTALIQRYLVEFREQLIEDPDLLNAIRSVLDAFVRVGWPSSVTLSYRLGDAFR